LFFKFVGGTSLAIKSHILTSLDEEEEEEQQQLDLFFIGPMNGRIISFVHFFPKSFFFDLFLSFLSSLSVCQLCFRKRRKGKDLFLAAGYLFINCIQSLFRFLTNYSLHNFFSFKPSMGKELDNNKNKLPLSPELY